MTKSSFDLFKSFAGELDPRTLQKKFLLSLLKLQNVHRGSIWIKKNNSYHCIEAAGKESDSIIEIDIDADQPSIVGWVIENGKRTVADTKSDGRHFRELEDNMAVKSSLILCFPLFLKEKEVYGAVQIIDTTPEKSCVNLDEDYLNYLQNLVDIGSVALSNAILYSRQVKEAESLKITLKELQKRSSLIGHSKSFQQCINLARNYANSDLHVLITGESGTGKELIANEIHRLGHRSKKPFLVQNCSAIPKTLLESELFGYRKGAFSGAVRDKKGLFEAADGGTVFLDEIGDMPFNIQAAILRVLQNNEIKPVGANEIIHVDVRIIAATNRDIKTMIGENRFRQDLFYRLSVLPLELPPLRERREDIPIMVKHFLKQESLRSGQPEKKLKPDAMQRLTTWSWPGNVRELENLIKYLMVAIDSEYIDAEDIPDHFFEGSVHDIHASSPLSESGDMEDRVHSRSSDFQSSKAYYYNGNINVPEIDRRKGGINFGNFSWQEVEEQYIHFTLHKNNWNVTWAAKDAGVNRSTFASRMRRLGISRSNLPQKA
ncbi:NtrC1 [Desulfamplus magnetovallimortis]|uniref:NtrC1 n=1 Tax=Desulfamplus magnetovallimortis TaxID=1246637 RepID=A0A1W1HH18_9BACT|nr:sigma 54-interacting transcriptional regulator [Desulfamplus magnetovallimortis]SLM31774.1 NtrC1 [Desulfamplus magnetovallimortis]